MANNFDGIKTQKFGTEIECTGLTRETAAKAIARVLHSESVYHGGSYDKYSVKDDKGRRWNIVYDSSIKCFDENRHSAGSTYAVEIVSPVLEYGDIALLQEVVRITNFNTCNRRLVFGHCLNYHNRRRCFAEIV